MKQKKRVIATSSFPTKIPLWQTITLYLLLDKFQASGIVQGVIYTLLVLWWIGSLSNMYFEDRRDVPGFGDM